MASKGTQHLIEHLLDTVEQALLQMAWRKANQLCQDILSLDPQNTAAMELVENGDRVAFFRLLDESRIKADRIKKESKSIWQSRIIGAVLGIGLGVVPGVIVLSQSQSFAAGQSIGLVIGIGLASIGGLIGGVIGGIAGRNFSR